MQKEDADSYCYRAQLSHPVYQLIIRNRETQRREVKQSTGLSMVQHPPITVEG